MFFSLFLCNTMKINKFQEELLSFSKNYSMTGYRIDMAAQNPDLIFGSLDRGDRCGFCGV